MKPEKKRGYDFIFSIGSACYCSYYLRQLNLQTKSYPFDWVRECCFENRADLIVSDFKDFFNKEDFEFLHKSNKFNNKDIYKNKRTNVHFVHDFPPQEEQSFDDAYPAQLAKYNRRIKRLYKEIQKSKKVLAVYLAHPTLNIHVDDETLIRIQQKLQQKFPKQQIDILYLESKPELYKTEPHQEYMVNDNIIKIYANFEPIVHYFNASDTSIPDKEVIQKIFSEFYLNKNKYLEIRKLKKGVGIYLLPRINTLLRFRFYLFGLRFDFCLGRVRG